MKVCTATITWVTFHNFGTFLQAYALQKYLVLHGVDNYIINDASIIKHRFNWKYEIKKAIWCFKPDYRCFLRYKRSSDRLFDKFKIEKLKVDYVTEEDLSLLDDKYDMYICGSDQIWNPFSLDTPKSSYFYAAFAKKKKIAYAPSIGVSNVPIQYWDTLKALTDSFDFLSAREQQGVDILSKLTGKHVEKVVDPTLLLSSNEWNELLPKNHNCRDKYVLGYFLSPNSQYINAAIEYAQQHSLKFKMFFTDKTYREYGCELIAAGPTEFIDYVKHAEYLFTDSFHGSVFAGIFHTQFITFKRFGNVPANQNSRVENLLDMMGIEEHLLDSQTLDMVNEMSEIDFEIVDENLKKHIEISKEYLLKALK